MPTFRVICGDYDKHVHANDVNEAANAFICSLEDEFNAERKLGVFVSVERCRWRLVASLFRDEPSYFLTKNILHRNGLSGLYRDHNEQE